MKKFTFINKKIEYKRLKLLGGRLSNFAVIRNEDLSDQDFSNRNLINIIFVNCNLNNCNFNNIISENLKFYRCSLTNSTFVNAKLERLTLSKCTGVNVCFDLSVLIDPIFYHSNFSKSTFDLTNIVNLRGQYASFCDIDFTTATITGTFVLIGNFKGADANPKAGFRTKKGGDENYKIKPCGQDCRVDPTYCKQPCGCNTNPDKIVMPIKFSKN